MVSLARRHERPYITPEHQGPLINIISWIAVVTMSLMVLLVLGSKLATRRKLSSEDLLLTIAMILSAGQTIAISVQTENGLGSYIDTLSPSQIAAFQKSGYASSMLYVAAVLFAKASTLTVLKRLTPNRTHRRLIWAVLAIVSAWGVSSFFGSAFQCAPTAEIVDIDKCFDQVAFWNVVGALDIVTDVSIMICPAVVVWNLQLARDKKAAVVTAFAFRMLAIVATILRLYYVPRAFDNSNFTHSNTGMAIATQIAIFCAIFASCAPHLRPFMDSMQAGYFSGAINDDKSQHYGYNSQNSPPTPGTRATLDTFSGPRSPRNFDNTSQRMSRHRSSDVFRTQSESRKPKRTETGEDEISNETFYDVSYDTSYDGRDGRSSENSTEMMVIKQTKEWSVTVEERTAAERVVNSRPFD